MKVIITIQVADSKPIKFTVDSEDEGSVADIPVTRRYVRAPGRRQRIIMDLLTSYGPLDVNTIKEKSGLSMNNVYTTCHSLVKRGWAEQTGRQPMVFRRVPDASV